MKETGSEVSHLSRGFRLGEWLVEPQTNRVVRGEFETHLRPRVMDVLVFLASRYGQVVTKEEILDVVWSTRIVAESALSSAVAEMRQALQDDPKQPRLMETIPKRGYRFLVRPRPCSFLASGDGPATSSDSPWPEGPEAVFVGRTAELQTLDRSLAEARSSRGRAVFVAGEAGSGKTALLAEFARQTLLAEPDVAVAGGRCHLHAGPTGPYLPFREALRVLSGDPEGGWLPGSGRGDLVRIAAGWGQVLAQVIDANGPSLAGTLLPGPAPRHPPGANALFEQLGATLRAFSARTPLVLLFDDLHWADPGTIALLFNLARHLPHSRILVVASYRPEEVAGVAGRHPLERAVDELVRYGGDAVVRLGDEVDRDFLDALVDTAPNRLDRAFRDALFALTEGQPLLTIELLRSLRAKGVLVPDEDGRWIVRGVVPWGGLPTRVEAIVRERIEGLCPASRAVLDMAAVEGEEFCAETVAAALVQPIADVVEILSGVLGRQRHLVTACRTRSVGGRRVSFYRFRHALFQRYLYERLDAAERALRHDSLAGVIRSAGGEETAERSAALARHLENGERPGLAAPWRLAGADRAISLGAPEAALESYAAALSLLDGEDESPETSALRRRAEAGRAMAAVLARGQGSLLAGEAFRNLRRLCAEVGDDAGAVRASVQLAGHHGARGEACQAYDLARDAVERARQDGVHSEISSALSLLGIAESVGGDLASAIETFNRSDGLRRESPGVELPVALSGHDPAIAAGCWWALALLSLGSPEQAMARGASTLEMARRRGHPYGLGLAHGVGVGLTLVIGRRGAEALDPAREVLAQANGHGYPTLLGLGEFLLGSALFERGSLEEGETRVRRGLEIMAATSHVSGRSLMLGRLSQILAACGRTPESLRVAEEAVAAAEAAGELNYLPELGRIHGEAVAAAGRGVGEAEALLLGALEAARKRGTLLFELRCALSVHRLRSLSETDGPGSRVAQARNLVAALRASFTEGFDTPDLVDADRLLAT